MEKVDRSMHRLGIDDGSNNKNYAMETVKYKHTTLPKEEKC